MSHSAEKAGCATVLRKKEISFISNINDHWTISLRLNFQSVKKCFQFIKSHNAENIEKVLISEIFKLKLHCSTILKSLI